VAYVLSLSGLTCTGMSSPRAVSASQLELRPSLSFAPIVDFLAHSGRKTDVRKAESCRFAEKGNLSETLTRKHTPGWVRQIRPKVSWSGNKFESSSAPTLGSYLGH
jgi:hypothetical protein